MTPEEKVTMPDLESRASQVIELLGNDGIIFAMRSHLRGTLTFYVKDLQFLLESFSSHKTREAELLACIRDLADMVDEPERWKVHNDIIKQARGE